MYIDPSKQKQAKHESYLRNKEVVIRKSAEKREANRQWLKDLKDKPCVDCGGKFPAVCMDYHHRDKSDKIASVGWLLTNRGRQSILEEIEKCDLVCANCHRIREYYKGL